MVERLCYGVFVGDRLCYASCFKCTAESFADSLAFAGTRAQIKRVTLPEDDKMIAHETAFLRTMADINEELKQSK